MFCQQRVSSQHHAGYLPPGWNQRVRTTSRTAIASEPHLVMPMKACGAAAGLGTGLGTGLGEDGELGDDMAAAPRLAASGSAADDHGEHC